jgi:hypothetical protein
MKFFNEAANYITHAFVVELLVIYFAGKIAIERPGQKKGAR